ncbi:hypothetical protein DMH04_11500 [Kibdelosporangium aridum]|uniref:Uncharacterized protein n=1 Tax=Kibdelosporangium aridum TaxID=2030 RepID=A0A428ZFN1_KIBAR|nr:hypothetical protein [Kibdelosporangium aridum]RSM86876.1 hypothetical protein DMH04_11500 [Kibdelosporangium aridum]
MNEIEAVDELANRVAPMVGRAVDELQIAAVLESQGFTDQVARERYGVKDVFALASVVYHRLPRDVEAPSDEQRTRRTFRVLSHGPLFLLPSLSYPAVYDWLGGLTMVRGLVFTTAIGWWWAMGMSLVAYRLLGHGLDHAAGRSLRILGGTGLGIVTLGSAAIDPRLWVFCLAQMGFQVSSCVMVIYKREARLALLMVPACAGGAAHLLFDVMLVALGCGLLSIVLTLAMSWREAGRAQPDVRKPPRMPMLLRLTGPSVAYSALCAAFLLNTDARFVLADLDLGLAVAPLVLGMGAVEWRAHRYSEQALDELDRSRSVTAFRRATQSLLIRELAYCLVILGCIALLMLGVLGQFGLLTTRGSLLVDAHVVLGGVFFLGFVLMRYEGLRWLLAIMPVVISTNVIVNYLLPGHEIAVFLVCCAALLVLFLLTSLVSAGEVRRYR